MGRYEKWIVAGIWSTTLLFPLVVLANALFGVFFDSDHMIDTLFIMGAAWRSYQGFTPVLDFGYFYGGVLEDGIAMAMRLFGHGIFAFDYFTLILTLVFGGAIFLAMRHRMSATGLAALILSVTVLILTRHPLEVDFTVAKMVSTHSFLYNRVGLAGVMIAGIFVALPTSDRRSELVGGVIVGLVVGYTMLIKPTFAILLPAAIAGLLVQRRWHSAGALVAGTVALLLLLDPLLARWQGAFVYGMGQFGEERAAGVGYLIVKSFRGPFVQPLSTFLAIVAVGYLLLQRVSLSSILGLMLVAIAGLGMTATMGGYVGQVFLPIAILVTLAASEIAARTRVDMRTPLQILAICMVLALALPHAANQLLATAIGKQSEGKIRIKEGPFQRYFALSSDRRPASEPRGYDVFADGVAALNALGDTSRWGIVADHGLSFEFAVLAKPVLGYPLWQRRTSPEFAEGQPLDASADIVMLGRNRYPLSLRAVLVPKMKADFRLCKTSKHWDIYARLSSNISGCSAPPAAIPVGQLP